MSPFTSAIESGDYRRFKLLLDSGADVNHAYDGQALYPLMQAVGGNAFYISDSDRIRQGELSSSRENNLIVGDLLEAGADPNRLDRNGFTPLFAAVFHNRIGSAWLLIRYGANVNVKSKAGWSPLRLATFHCQKQMAMLLIDSGANLEDTDKFGRSLVDVAKEKNCMDILKLIESKRATGEKEMTSP